MPMRHSWIAVGLTALLNGCSCSPTTIAPARTPNGGRALSIAVSSTNDQRIIVATETGGLFRTFDGGKSWQHLGGLPTYMTRDVAIAATSANTIVATTLSQYRRPNDYHASGDHMLWRSTDSGASWALVPAPRRPMREAWVRAARSFAGDDSTFDLYVGDGMDPFRQNLTVAVPPDSAGWKLIGVNHPDANDMAFDTDRRVPILVATDGGVHRSTDGGRTFQLTGGGFGGFIALQVSEMTGQSVTGASPHQDLYFSTQDNFIWASFDGGQTWPNTKFGEGRYLRTAPTSTTDQGVRVTGLGCGGCVNFLSTPHLVDISRWPNAPVGDTTVQIAETPFPIRGDAYLQNVANKDSTPTRYEFFLSQNAGGSWTKSFSVLRPPRGAPLFSGSLSDPVVYQGIERSTTLPLGGTAYGLMRGSNLAGQPAVRRADSLGITALGSLHTPISRYVVFGVDPANSDHLIAPDAAAGQMKYSADGGVHWFAYPPLTQAVTDNGQFLFTVGDITLASVVAWDPYDSCHILVGTTQNGVIRSADGGNSWKRVDGSRAATLVSSFYFPPTGKVWMSTNGRGLWTMKLDRGSGRLCRFPTRPPRDVHDSIVVVNPITGLARAFGGLRDSIVCQACSVVVVREGWISDLRMSGDVVQEIAITGGKL